MLIAHSGRILLVWKDAPGRHTLIQLDQPFPCSYYLLSFFFCTFSYICDVFTLFPSFNFVIYLLSHLLYSHVLATVHFSIS